MASRSRIGLALIVLAQLVSGHPSDSVATTALGPVEARHTEPSQAKVAPRPPSQSARSKDNFCRLSTSLGALSVVAQETDRWDGGATWELTLSNLYGEDTLSQVQVQFILPGSAKVETWGGSYTVNLPRVKIALPEWNATLTPQESHVMGLNVFPATDVCGMRVVSVDFGDPDNTPTPMPLEDNQIDGGDVQTPPPNGGSGNEAETPEPGDNSGQESNGGFYEEPASATPIFIDDPYASTSMAEFAPPLSTHGNRIINKHGDTVLMRGINWFGFETSTFAAHGLWTRNWQELMQQVSDEGFNVLRLPFSQQLVNQNPMPNSIDYYLNPDLIGLTSLQVLDRIVEEAGKHEIYVLLDRHTLRADERTPLWYTGNRSGSSRENPYGEAAWIEGLEELAWRYLASPWVMGFDLHNEPHGAASWGTDVMDTDWRLAAERAGNRLLAINPKLLIVVEGVEGNVQGDNSQSYWWGGNLRGVQNYPVRLTVPGQLVYSPHVYGAGVYPQAWFYDPSYPDNLPGIWEAYWAYVAQQNIAPIWIGEFGGHNANSEPLAYGTDPWREAVWQEEIVDFQIDWRLSGTYWSLNPNSSDTGGFLNEDWISVVEDKATLLSPWLLY